MWLTDCQADKTFTFLYYSFAFYSLIDGQILIEKLIIFKRNVRSGNQISILNRDQESKFSSKTFQTERQTAIKWMDIYN